MNGVHPNGKSTGGITGKGFLPGHSGNPGGRPKGLAALVREQTKDGQELVDLMTSILRGKLVIGGHKPTHRDRIMAAEWLANRGWGKPIEMQVELPANDVDLQVEIELARMLAQGKIVWAEGQPESEVE